MQTLMKTIRFQHRNVIATFGTQLRRQNHETKTTVDRKEVDFHSNLAENWWSLDGPVAPLHSLNKIR